MAHIRHLAFATVVALFGLGLPAVATAQDSDDEQTHQSDAPIVLAQAEGESGGGEGGESGGGGSSSGKQSGSKLQRSDRMEFDARLIRGERASGAVFLFQRTPRELPSMVKRRRTYLEESVRTVLGRDWAKTFSKKRTEAISSDNVPELEDDEPDDNSDDSDDDMKIDELSDDN